MHYAIHVKKKKLIVKCITNIVTHSEIVIRDKAFAEKKFG